MATLLALLAAAPAWAAETVIVVVRHAEKASDDPRDPSLSEAGRKRAQALAESLARAGLDAVYTTQFRRTRQTAEPAAQAAGVEPQVRPVSADNAPGYGAGLLAEIRALPAGSTVLVVGHSNTVPGLVEAFSGQRVPEMPETEYDRYTVVVLGEDGARVLSSRY